MIRVVPLDESFRGVELTFRYWTEYYYDVTAQEGPEGFSFVLERRNFGQPVEKTFVDTLLSQWLEAPQLYGAEVDGGIRGYLELNHERWNNRMRVTNLLVEEGFRRQGIGRLLMETAVEKAREAGARALVLETQSCNDQAIRFYRRNGFSLVGFDLTAYSQTDVQKKEVRLEMARPVCGQTKE